MPNGSPHRETQRHREAFEAWYGEHRSAPKAAERLRICERVLREWAVRYGWQARADARDAEAARLADADAIRRRAEMLTRHRQAGELLVRRGMEYHAKRPIERAADATQAIQRGIEIERTAEGLPSWVAAVLNATDEQLAAMEQRLSAGAGDPEPAPDELERLGYVADGSEAPG